MAVYTWPTPVVHVLDDRPRRALHRYRPAHTTGRCMRAASDAAAQTPGMPIQPSTCPTTSPYAQTALWYPTSITLN